MTVRSHSAFGYCVCNIFYIEIYFCLTWNFSSVIPKVRSNIIFLIHIDFICWCVRRVWMAENYAFNQSFFSLIKNFAKQIEFLVNIHFVVRTYNAFLVDVPARAIQRAADFCLCQLRSISSTSRNKKINYSQFSSQNC